MPKLIALYSSTPGCGKTTIADHLRTQHGFVRISFADPLRAMIKALLVEIYSPSDATFLLSEGKEQPLHSLAYSPTTRHLLRTLGTEWGRTCVGPHFWADIWKDRTRKLLEAGASVVCDDLRFPEELAAVEALGGEAWRITRPAPEPSRAEDLWGEGHASDGALEGMPMWWGHLIRNDGSLENLLQYVDTCLQMEVVR